MQIRQINITTQKVVIGVKKLRKKKANVKRSAVVIGNKQRNTSTTNTSVSNAEVRVNFSTKAGLGYLKTTMRQRFPLVNEKGAIFSARDRDGLRGF